MSANHQQTGLPQPIELTIVMPCLNEADTLATCIRKARLGVDPTHSADF